MKFFLEWAWNIWESLGLPSFSEILTNVSGKAKVLKQADLMLMVGF